MATSRNLVDNVDGERCTVKAHAATVPGRWRERHVTVVLRGPLSRIADVLDVELSRAGVSQPHEGAAFLTLAACIEFEGVVRDCGSEIGTPLGLTVITVGARICEHLDATASDLNRQSVGMSVCGDAEVAVRTAVAAAPDLRMLPCPRSEHCNPSICKSPWPARGTTWHLTDRADERGNNRAGRVGCCVWPPVQSPEKG